MSDKIITIKQTDTGDRLLPKTVKEAIIDLIIDLTFNEESQNPQSGMAVAEAIENVVGDLEDLTTTDKDNIVDAVNEVKASIPDEQIQTDWSQANNTQKDYIKNKPTIGNGTITFTQGDVLKGTITTNQTGDTTIALDAGGTVDQTYDSTSVNAQSGVAVAQALAGVQASIPISYEV